MPRRLARPTLTLPLALTACCAALACLPMLARAELTIVVNTTADQAPSMNECEGLPGDCSVRQAVHLANATPGNDTIVLGPLRYELTIPGNEEELGATGDLDVFSEQLRIEGAGARKTTIAAAAGLEDRVFDVEAGAGLTVVGATVGGGDVAGESGGGIRTREAALSLVGVAIVDNTSRDSGRGGGLGLIKGETTITGSLIARNRNSGDGGGIYAEEGSLAIENSTIADNRVETILHPSASNWGAYGGAMEIAQLSDLILRNVTISGNSIADNNGGISSGESAAIEGGAESYEIVNTIVWGNTGTNVSRVNQCSSTFDSLGHNVEQPVAGEEPCFTGPAIITADPLLGPLADNGGETDTLALNAGSPAIDAGLASSCPATDQRGTVRPAGACDIGAFEFVPSPPPAPAPAAAKPKITRKGKVVVKAAGKRFKVWPGIRVSCPAGGATCAGTLVAKARLGGATSSAAKVTRIGKARFTVAPGKAKALALKLTGKASERLVAVGKLRVAFTISSRAGEAVAKKTFRVAVKPPRPAKR